MNLPINKIIQGDALTELKKLPSESINCCMSSPPYWALRDYGDSVSSIWDGDENCEHSFEFDEDGIGANMGLEGTTKPNLSGFCSKCNAWKGQLGLEPTFDLFIKHLCDIYDEVKRVLRKDGTCWVNLGDTYYTKSGSGFKNDNITGNKADTHYGLTKANELRGQGRLQAKNLSLIPFRFAIEMQNRGWILRNVIIWHKPNCMPSSVKDRFTVDFEYVFFFVKNRKYWFETQYGPVKQESIKRTKYKWDGHREKMSSYVGMDIKKMVTKMPRKQDNVPSKNSNTYKGFNDRYEAPEYGRNKRTVWSINPKGFPEAHFAVYPEELCETPLKAGCPEFVCDKCKKPRKRIYEKINSNRKISSQNNGQPYDVYSGRAGEVEFKEKGWNECSCKVGFSGGIVLDPFFGSGTTGVVALKQNKKFIGIELNKEYHKIAIARIKKELEQKKLTEVGE